MEAGAGVAFALWAVIALAFLVLGLRARRKLYVGPDAQLWWMCRAKPIRRRRHARRYYTIARASCIAITIALVITIPVSLVVLIVIYR